MAAILDLAAILDFRKWAKWCSYWILTNIGNKNCFEIWICLLFGQILVKKRLNMVATLKFKMAAEDALEKKGSNSGFVLKGIWKVKSIGSTSVANFALYYITSCTIGMRLRLTSLNDKKSKWPPNFHKFPYFVHTFIKLLLPMRLFIDFQGQGSHMLHF